MTTSGPSRGMRGAIVWAFAGFQPGAPFDVVDSGGEVRSYPAVGELAEAMKKGELPQAARFLVQAKLRPVVLLQDRPRGRLPEFAALKLARFTKLARANQQQIRAGGDDALFYLPLNRSKYGLKQENAVDLNSLVRLHQSVIVTSPVGYLDENEIDVLGRRLAKFLDIDLGPAIRQGVIDRWEQLVAAQQQRRSKP